MFSLSVFPLKKPIPLSLVDPWHIHLWRWSQRLVRAPPKSVPGLNREEPRGRRAGGWCTWTMDNHGRCADVSDDGVTARAASYHSCPRRRPVSVCAMMESKGACASHVPHASLDLSNQAQLSPAPWPRLAKERRLLSPSRGSPDPAFAWSLHFLVLSHSR
jgi:hypothetical protein